MITLLLYLTATVLTALSWDLWSFMFFRFLTGAGIGGEYAAIILPSTNSSLRVGVDRPTWRLMGAGGWGRQPGRFSP
jgi:MFS family permease